MQNHLVTFKTAEGRDGQHVAQSLDEAISFVERVRNHEGAQDVQLFRLTPVPIEFKAYYRVEVNAAEAASAAQIAVPASSATGALPVDEPAPELLTESAAANGRRLFSRT